MEEKKTTLLPEYYYSLDEITELLRENWQVKFCTLPIQKNTRFKRRRSAI
jgi:hypothetical protein